MSFPSGIVHCWYVENDGLKQHDEPKLNDTADYMKLKCNLFGCKQAVHNWFRNFTKRFL